MLRFNGIYYNNPSMPFDEQTAKDAGQKGGRSRSNKKLRAARRNAKKGGRPASRTLAERLLEQKLTPHQLEAINREWYSNKFLFVGESQRLFEFFEVSATVSFSSKTWCRKSGRMPKEIRYIVGKFRLAAQYILSEVKPPAPPKDYVRVPDPYSKGELAEWRMRHPGHPIGTPPPRRQKKYFRDLPMYNEIVGYFKDNPNMTTQDITELGGNATGAVAEELLRYLRFLSKL